ncbi:MAG: hypothetical protein HFH73_02645 [Lachnospiraceae bacterium]|nr:hypothetical protein [Lachnospiraceae bacterium]
MRNLRRLLCNVKQRFEWKMFTARTSILAVAAGIITPMLANETVASATDVNDTLGFGKKIDPVKTLKNTGNIAINIGSAIAVGTGVVFLIGAVQAFFQARESHDSQQMMQGFTRLFIGIGCAAAGGIAFFFVGQAK